MPHLRRMSKEQKMQRDRDNKRLKARQHNSMNDSELNAHEHSNHIKSVEIQKTSGVCEIAPLPILLDKHLEYCSDVNKRISKHDLRNNKKLNETKVRPEQNLHTGQTDKEVEIFHDKNLHTDQAEMEVEIGQSDNDKAKLSNQNSCNDQTLDKCNVPHYGSRSQKMCAMLVMKIVKSVVESQHINQEDIVAVNAYRQRINSKSLLNGLHGPGLVNIERTCALNAMMQILTHIPIFVQPLLDRLHSSRCVVSSRQCLMCDFEQHLHQSHTGNQRILRPSWLPYHLSKMAPGINFFSDQCVTDLLDLFLNGINDIDEASSKIGLVDTLFSIILKCSNSCLARNCEYVKESAEVLYRLDLPLPNIADRTLTIHDCLVQFFSTETLAGTKCDDCGGLQQQIKKSMIIQASPPVLLVAFKRMVHGLRKDTRFVHFPLDLDISTFCSDSNQNCHYYLQGVIVHKHIGQHYVCYTKGKDNNWYFFDDKSVTKVCADEVVKEEATLLCYVQYTHAVAVPVVSLPRLRLCDLPFLTQQQNKTTMNMSKPRKQDIEICPGTSCKDTKQQARETCKTKSMNTGPQAMKVNTPEDKHTQIKRTADIPRYEHAHTKRSGDLDFRKRENLAKLEDPRVKERQRIFKQIKCKDPNIKEKERVSKQESCKDPNFKIRESLLKCEDPKVQDREIIFNQKDRSVKEKETLLKEELRKDRNVKERKRLSKQKSRKDPDIRSAEKLREQNLKRKMRKDPNVKERERLSKQKLRNDPDVTSAEKLREKKLKRKMRKDPNVKERERLSKQKLRNDPDVTSAEKLRDNNLKRKMRKDPNVKERERLSKQKLRNDPDVTSAEKLRDKNLKRKVRKDPDIRSAEKVREKNLKRKMRKDPNVKERERLSKQKLRNDPDVTSAEKLREKNLKRKMRKDPNVKERERLSKQKLRNDPDVTSAEKLREKNLKRKMRKDPNVKERDRLSKQKLRKDSDIRSAEKLREKNLKRKSREDQNVKQKEKHAKKLKNITDFHGLVLHFHDLIKSGPEYECTCCSQMWYFDNVSCVGNISLPVTLQECISGTTSVDNKEWICQTCLKDLKHSKMPKLAKANQNKFPDITPDLQGLTSLETVLISPRIVFQQIRSLPRGGQLSVHGNIVNVPANVSSTLSSLPRNINEHHTIPVKLKRKLSYNHCTHYENIRPAKVLKAAKCLAENSVFEEQIVINEHWMTNDSAYHLTDNDSETANEQTPTVICDVTQTDKVQKCSIINKNMKYNEGCSNGAVQASNKEDHCCIAENSGEHTSKEHEDSDQWTEGEDVDCEKADNMDTLLHPSQFDDDGSHTLCVAPGEGNRPLGLFYDQDSEYLAFPTIFCGKRRSTNEERTVPVHYSDICKLELRHSDSRVSKNVPNIFYKLKKLQIKQISDKAQTAMRKCSTGGKKITAGDLKTKGLLDNLILLDEGYRVFRTLRSSPPYWESAKKDLFAMIRQYDIPTFFCSFSAADSHWTDLMKILGHIVDNKDYTDEEISSFSWDKRQNFIKTNPVICVRHFQHRFQIFMKAVLKSELHPLGELVHFFYRIEFQNRGSPHVHMFLWIKDAPCYNINSDEEVVTFIDQYISCGKNLDIPTLVGRQVHKHSRTCQKHGKKLCRFGFPLPPMSKTVILMPLDIEADIDIDEKATHKMNYTKIQNLLDDMMDGDDITFEQLLKKLDLSEDVYLMALRSSILKDTIFLKRSPSEIRVNAYNNTTLRAWQANMDIQYVIDPYAVAMYIASYITKGQRGMSTLLHNACEEVKKGNETIRNQIRHIGNKFLNHVEVSAQEAVYLVLQMPLRKSSTDFVFVNTSPPDKRPFLLKKMDQIMDLPDSSTSISSDNMFKKYSRRPRALQHMCLADFVSHFNIIHPMKGKLGKKSDQNADEFLPEENEDDNEDDDPEAVGNQDTDNEVDPSNDDSCGDYEQQNRYNLKGGTVLKRRAVPKVIRYVRYNRSNDAENYYRELLLLFHPWRKEDVDILLNCDTYEDRYNLVRDSVDAKHSEYNHHAEELDMAVNNLTANEGIQDVWDHLAPETEHVQHQDDEEGSRAANEYAALDPGTDLQFQNYDLAQDLGITSGDQHQELMDNRMADHDYRALVRSLNQEQWEFFLHVLHWVKTKDEPIYNFLSGGAGVGKTFLLKALHQALLRYFNTSAGCDPEDLTVLLVAPTGKAAFNIHGNTIHSGFQVPATQGFKYKKLHSDRLNTIRCKFRRLKLIFIDEISMVGNGMLNFIHLRLCDIKQCNEAFGGLSVISLGDLFQLKPVFDGWGFQNLKENYGPLATNLWHDHFTMFELNQIMRQKDDEDFAKLLNRLREGKQSCQDVKLLKTRLTTIHDSNYPHEAQHLFVTNALVEGHNNRLFDLTNSEKIMISAQDVVIGDVAHSVKVRIRRQVPDDPSKTMGLFTNLPIALGLRYEITVNVDPADGLANGAGCVVMKIEKLSDSSSRPIILWVKFHDESVGRRWRQEHGHLYVANVDRTWTPIIELSRNFTVGRTRNAHVLRKQFPLRPSGAKTLHRSQGDTLDEAVMDFGNRKSFHIHYVGLSRVKNLSRIHLLSLNESKISVSKDVQQEMESLRNERAAKLCVPFLYKLPSDDFKILFHNVRSLHLHYQDVLCDHNVKAADINVFVETRLWQRDNDLNFTIPNFSLHRNDYPSQRQKQRSSYGTAIYSKLPLPPDNEYHVKQNIEISVIQLQQPNLQLCAVYMSGKATIPTLLNVFNDLFQGTKLQTPTVVIGYFNVDLLKESAKSRRLTETLATRYGLEQINTEFTTDSRSIIDHIYTNLHEDMYTSGVLESYYSDHKPLFISIKR